MARREFPPSFLPLTSQAESARVFPFFVSKFRIIRKRSTLISTWLSSKNCKKEFGGVHALHLRMKLTLRYFACFPLVPRRNIDCLQNSIMQRSVLFATAKAQDSDFVPSVKVATVKGKQKIVQIRLQLSHSQPAFCFSRESRF